MVTNLGLGLISLGVKQDDIVMIFSENCGQWLVADLARLSIGSRCPDLRHQLREEAAYIINDSAQIPFVSDQDHLAGSSE